MQIDTSKSYVLRLTDEEVVDAVCYWLSNYRSRTDLIQVVAEMRNTDVKVSRSSGETLFKFSKKD